MVVEQAEGLGVAAPGELDERDQPGAIGLGLLGGGGLAVVVEGAAAARRRDRAAAIRASVKSH